MFLLKRNGLLLAFPGIDVTGANVAGADTRSAKLSGAIGVYMPTVQTGGGRGGPPSAAPNPAQPNSNPPQPAGKNAPPRRPILIKKTESPDSK